ncbi:SLBB domain-containing protein [Pedobacter sp. L105]|uniref:SLBB domain-containing protein n=1 Tax=Pedobacter sp. L105 TaxID=1641871 RepID=UPI00131D4EEA|nr:SLBB domain-containing protein [Pedobacter sp. L105]
MYLNKKIILFFFVALICLTVSGTFAQSLKGADWSQVKVDQLSDADLSKIQDQLQANGMSVAQAQQMALSKGMSPIEWNKLQMKLGQAGPGQKKDDTAPMLIAPPVRETVTSDYKSAPKASNSKVFGASLFDSESLSFEPNLRIATPSNYILGPDDQLVITVSGYQETNIQTQVDAEGAIFIPQIGAIHIIGLSIEQATAMIRNRMSQTVYPSLKNGSSRLVLSLGKIRSIHITIIGAAKPGNYTVSSLSTLFNSLYLCGGPGDINSYRNIELIRNNKIYQKIDLYQFLIRGDQKDNVLLKENDVINIPVYSKQVVIKGQVKREGIFELKDGETLENLLFFSGGYTAKAYKASVKVKQITDVERKIRDIPKIEIPAYQPANGEEFQVDSVMNRVENAVSISGAVYMPGQFELTPGITISGLIKKAGGLRDNVFTDRAILSRTYPNGIRENITFNVSRVLDGIAADIPLIKKDSIIIATASEFKSDYKVTIRGEVRKPADYPFGNHQSLKDVLFLAGGFTDAASSYHIEIGRRIVIEGADKSIDSLAKVFDCSTEKDLTIESKQFILEPYDIITVRKNPTYTKQQKVIIVGEINYPGTYTIESKKERISDLLKRAGGVTLQAYQKGIFLVRQDADTISQKQVVKNIQTSIKDTSAKVIEDVTKNNVRIAVDYEQVLQHPGSIQDYVLQDGDSLRVLKLDPLVKLSGEVLLSTKTGFIQGKSLRYYITQAGGVTDEARRSKIYVLYPNGHINRAKNRLFGLIHSYPKIETGAEIVVPRKSASNGLSTTQTIGLTSAITSMVSLIIVTISTLK